MQLRQPCQGGGAAKKAFLTVRYTHDSPGLHTRLFCKFPHEEDLQQKYLVSCILCHDEPEVRWAQLLASKSPVAAPKTYFAEYCKETTNFMLITERIEFADEEMQPPGTAAAEVLKPLQVGRHDGSGSGSG